MLGTIGALAFLTIRGILLWLIVPLGALIWVLTLQQLRETRVSLGAFLGWIDNNVAFVLVRGPFEPVFPTTRIAWIPTSKRSTVVHRIGVGDLL